MNSEELRILEDERQKILDEILEELQTKSLKKLFHETREKESRMKKARDALKELYEDLHRYEYMVRNAMVTSRDRWMERAHDKQKEIDELENDYSNYIQGGYGPIARYLRE